ncbi:MAG TPA: flavin reductase family protein, partial [Acetobacteraceae bacterium]|nr:flavin reductase family protein [Acetobacteraceae bacterium]
SAQFASKGGDKFRGVDLRRGHDGIPLLRDCAARFECRTAFQHEGGDHVIFVGEVQDFVHSDRPPLVFHGGRYGTVLRREKPEPPPVTAETSLTPDDLIYLVSRAFHQIREQAVAERRRRGWSESEYAILSILGRDEGRTLSEMQAIAPFHGWTVTEEAAQSLERQGLVVRDDAGRLGLTLRGRQTIIEQIAILKSGEADALEDLDPSEVLVLKQLLQRVSRKSQSALEAVLRRTDGQSPI